MKVTLLGTGTSHGVPAIACDCEVCKSTDPHDKRTRSSALIKIQNAGHEEAILIDIGPDFRAQCLRENIKKVDTVLLTHSHADHLHGLDDIRIFSHTASRHHAATPPLTLYGNAETLHDVQYRFDYVFHPTQAGGGKPLLTLCDCTVFDENPSTIEGIEIAHIPMMHGNVKTTGYVFRAKRTIAPAQPAPKDSNPSNLDNPASNSDNIPSNLDSPASSDLCVFAYLTDCNYISEDSIAKIQSFAPSIDYLVIDGLKDTAHSTHFAFLEALDVAERLCPRHTRLTHICHKNSHVAIQAYLDHHICKNGNFPRLYDNIQRGGTVQPAFDGETFLL